MVKSVTCCTFHTVMSYFSVTTINSFRIIQVKQQFYGLDTTGCAYYANHTGIKIIAPYISTASLVNTKM